MRALENELERTFPAIKKQIDSLQDAKVIEIDKNEVKRAIRLHKDGEEIIKTIFMHSLQSHLKELFSTYNTMIAKYYFGGIFGTKLEMDLVVLYQNCEKPQIDILKNEINSIFNGYFVDVVSVVFMSADEREKRYRLADRFVLNILRSLQKV